MSPACLLVFHGSLDPRPQASVERLAELVAQSQVYSEANTAVEAMVGTASLELSPIPLHQQIQEFAIRALASGYSNIQVVPLFLLPGVHVMEDIPNEVTLAQQAVGQAGQILLRPYLGNNFGLGNLLATQIAAIEAEAWILLAHGSRRSGFRQHVEAMATRLKSQVVRCAYWSVPPSLAERVQELVNAGYQRIAILPYFLFAGGITDAIALGVAQLAVQFPSTELQLAEPIGASAELAALIGDLMEK
ncbi:MAG: sirohydrochlorin chelatase [Chroococcidiopsidaceae cyanobacterium CP_BM_ER_R8_30]|nr:sirohydrochlorin chelatase [Chroococcidiopsidaceae cyanobacterium CP_BM_ER_R8_30]